MLTVSEIIQIIANTPKSLELQIIEDTVKSINEKAVDVRKRFTSVSDNKIMVTFEIMFKNTSTFQFQAEIMNVENVATLKALLIMIDRYFLTELIKVALTYKSISNRDYEDLQYYKRKYGAID